MYTRPKELFLGAIPKLQTNFGNCPLFKNHKFEKPCNSFPT